MSKRPVVTLVLLFIISSITIGLLCHLYSWKNSGGTVSLVIPNLSEEHEYQKQKKLLSLLGENNSQIQNSCLNQTELSDKEYVKLLDQTVSEFLDITGKIEKPLFFGFQEDVSRLSNKTVVENARRLRCLYYEAETLILTCIAAKQCNLACNVLDSLFHLNEQIEVCDWHSLCILCETSETLLKLTKQVSLDMTLEQTVVLEENIKSLQILLSKSFGFFILSERTKCLCYVSGMTSSATRHLAETHKDSFISEMKILLQWINSRLKDSNSVFLLSNFKPCYSQEETREYFLSRAMQLSPEECFLSSRYHLYKIDTMYYRCMNIIEECMLYTNNSPLFFKSVDKMHENQESETEQLSGNR
ncbi:MAG: hypothetical protein Q4G68_00030 [Planctomycetia bacterium]|nr:hypothetical protein [Planctomycetia bacterium]